MREATVKIILQKLTPTQSTIIRSAAQHLEGKIALPDTLHGRARSATIKGLLIRGWIVEVGDGHLLTDAGYAAIDQQRPSPSPTTIEDSPARDIVQHCRPGTKLAKNAIALLCGQKSVDTSVSDVTVLCCASLDNKKPAKPFDLRVFVLLCISLNR
jgi:hypothetical protein